MLGPSWKKNKVKCVNFSNFLDFKRNLGKKKHTGFLLFCLSINITLLIERLHLLTLGPLWEKKYVEIANFSIFFF